MGDLRQIVVVAQFKIKAECVEEWRALLLRHSANCVQLEPGCLQFDVAQDATDPTEWTLYEVYRDETSLDEHRRTAHFTPFFNVAKTLFESRHVRQLRRVASQSRQG